MVTNPDSCDWLIIHDGEKAAVVLQLTHTIQLGVEFSLVQASQSLYKVGGG